MPKKIYTIYPTSGYNENDIYLVIARCIMVSLQKGFGSDSAPAKSFEEIYKTAYSHGLEAIYTLENVDVKSIRRLQDAPPIISEEVINPLVLLKEPLQQRFDFGMGFRDWVEPFLLQEPIQVLALSKQAEKCLIEHGKGQLGDLMRCDLRSLIFLKGMGQGHIEEIKTKLSLYLEGREVQKAHSIDFLSWLRCLTAGVQSRKKVHVVLEAHELEQIIPMTSVESMELRRLSSEAKEDWVDEGIAELTQLSKQDLVKDNMAKIAKVFIIPWLRGRLGLATEEELAERLERISVAPKLAQKAVSFFADVYYEQAFPLKNSLYEVEKGIYAGEATVAQAYGQVCNLAKTYFYKPEIRYPLHHLTLLLQREFACAWIGFPDGFIEKALRLSSFFKVYKGPNGGLEIKSVSF